MKTTLAAGLVVAFLSSAALAQTATNGKDTKVVVKTSKGTPGTLAQLNKRIPEVSFQDLPFDQVVDWVAQYTGMNVVVRWQTLQDAGISRDKAITITVKNLRLSQVLWMIMNEVGGTDLKLAYRASGNLLILSTAADLGNEMIVRVYDVSDLLVRVRNFTNAPQVDIGGQQGGGGGGGGAGGAGGGNQNVFGGGGSGGGQNEQQGDEQNQNDRSGQPDPEMTRLMNIIERTIEPDSWEVNNGKGSIQAFRKQLIVRNNILVHHALGGPVTEGAE